MKVNLRSPYARMILKVLPILVAFALLFGIRWAEYTFLPVVRDFHLTNLDRTANYIVMSGYMRKVRDCKYVGISAEGVTANGHVDLPLKFIDNNNSRSDNGTRPQGTQDWGPWRIVIPASPDILALNLSSVHSCHLAWETTTRLASVPLLAVEKSTE